MERTNATTVVSDGLTPFIVRESPAPVYAELEPERVDVLGDAADPVRELVRVGHDAARGGIAVSERPAVLQSGTS